MSGLLVLGVSAAFALLRCLPLRWTHQQIGCEDECEKTEAGLALAVGHEQAEWQKRTDCDVLVIHDIFLGQRKVLDDRLRLGHLPGIQQEDGPATIATRIPFADSPIEIELSPGFQPAWRP
jgi:hypothetical protein